MISLYNQHDIMRRSRLTAVMPVK